jgi:hypothetical protein
VGAALNLVNGWMFTGLGPFYLKDSSTAQNIMAAGAAVTLAGRGVADVVTSLADLRRAGLRQGGGVQGGQLVSTIHTITTVMVRDGMMRAPICLPKYAEIHIYEPVVVPEHGVEWRPIIDHQFERTILGLVSKVEKYYGPQGAGSSQPPKDEKQPKDKDKSKNKTDDNSDGTDPAAQATRQAGSVQPIVVQPTALENEVERSATDRMAQRFGTGLVPATAGPVRQAGAVVPGAAAPGGVTVNVNPRPRLFSRLWPFACKRKPTQTIEGYIISENELQPAGGGNAGVTTSEVRPGSPPAAVLPSAPRTVERSLRNQ